MYKFELITYQNIIVMRNSSSIRNLSFLFLFLFVFAGCDSVTPEAEPDAPDTIPSQAFALNMDMFKENQVVGKSEQGFANWINAAFRTAAAVKIADTILEVPLTLTEAIQQVPPVFNDNAFVWSYEEVENGQTSSIALKAQIETNFIDWSMKVTGVDEEQNLTFENFLLYRAKTFTDTEQGNFSVYFPTENGSLHVMDGTYNVESESKHTLSFTIPEGVDEIGGIEAVFTQDVDQIMLDLTDAEGQKHLIEWNETTHKGSITADDYNNGEKSCWDETLRDVACEVAS